MEKLTEIVSVITGWIWGLPMIILLLGGGIFLTVRLGFFQFRYFPHILKMTFGKILSKSDAPGSITPFQATTSALASTVGASNIVGVPVAIALGGPGAIFWMWLVALIGMATKYSEVVLGVKHREKNAEGEYVGGPMYYIDKGLGWKHLAKFFAFGLMIVIIAGTMVQSNALSSTVEGAFGLSPLVTGLFVTFLVGLIVYGGIKRIGKVTEKLVPIMVVVYLLSALTVLVVNVTEIPSAFLLIFHYAFTPISAAGGFAGAGVAAAIRWGLARGMYSNEAGMGTASIAHATAKTDHPAKQGFWGIFEVFIDTIVILTITALVVITSGMWMNVGPEEASTMVTGALSQVLGASFAGTFISLSLLCFVLSTIVVIIYYGEKQAEYLFGIKFSKVMRVVYMCAIIIGAIGGLQFVWQFLDLLLGLIIIPNVIALLFLSKQVREITDDYFTNHYKKESGKDPNDQFKKQA